MNQCGVNRYLSVCNVPVQVSKDGYAGPYAMIYMPFASGLYFFSGGQFTDPGAVVPQDNSRLFNGVRNAGTPSDCGLC